ncbi:TPM domain-containing protein [Microbacterium oxydans]|nr:TPM domain-containing protein [Microbacterium oxydans]
MTKRWLTLAALALAVVAGAFSTSAASATDPVTLDAGYVTDQAGVLSADEEATVEARLQELTDNSSADLFVVLVDDFTNPSDNVQWADTVAQNNNLGTEQYLLAIAVDGRSYYISAAPDGPVSFGQLDSIEDKMVPLRRGRRLGRRHHSRRRRDPGRRGRRRAPHRADRRRRRRRRAARVARRGTGARSPPAGGDPRARRHAGDTGPRRPLLHSHRPAGRDAGRTRARAGGRCHHLEQGGARLRRRAVRRCSHRGVHSGRRCGEGEDLRGLRSEAETRRRDRGFDPRPPRVAHTHHPDRRRDRRHPGRQHCGVRRAPKARAERPAGARARPR